MLLTVFSRAWKLPSSMWASNAHSGFLLGYGAAGYPACTPNLTPEQCEKSEMHSAWRGGCPLIPGIDDTYFPGATGGRI